MRTEFQHRPWLALISLYAWWLLLGGGYLHDFWLNPVVGGADGSGHVAILHLYALREYPDIQGWFPEFFGGCRSGLLSAAVLLARRDVDEDRGA